MRVCKLQVSGMRNVFADLQEATGSPAFVSLIKGLLNPNPKRRLTPATALKHSFFTTPSYASAVDSVRSCLSPCSRASPVACRAASSGPCTNPWFSQHMCQPGLCSQAVCTPGFSSPAPVSESCVQHSAPGDEQLSSSSSDSSASTESCQLPSSCSLHQV